MIFLCDCINMKSTERYEVWSIVVKHVILDEHLTLPFAHLLSNLLEQWWQCDCKLLLIVERAFSWFYSVFVEPSQVIRNNFEYHSLFLFLLYLYVCSTKTTWSFIGYRHLQLLLVFVISSSLRSWIQYQVFIFIRSCIIDFLSIIVKSRKTILCTA